MSLVPAGTLPRVGAKDKPSATKTDRFDIKTTTVADDVIPVSGEWAIKCDAGPMLVMRAAK
jgi:hypothetical protein